MQIVDVNAEEFAMIVPTMPRGQLAILVKAHVKSDNTVGARGQLKIFLWEWLTHLNLLSDLQIDHFFSHYETALKRIVTALEDNQMASTFATVTLADRRYMSWSPLHGFYDVATDTVVPHMPEVAVTLIVCHVIGLLRQKQTWLKKIRKGGAHA